MADNDDIDRDVIWDDFHEVVNMTPSELKKWLETEESREVGFRQEGESESVGHQSGRRIIAIKEKKKSDLDDEDYSHMRKVVGYAHRHLKQEPAKDVEHSRWRYALMNWRP